VAAPFYIASGGTYSLTNNQTQTVLISYSPSGAATDSGTVSFAGGGGATASVSGQLVAVMPGLSFPSYEGTITSPMVTNSGGYIYETVDVSNEGQQGVTNGGTATYFFNITNPGQYFVSANVLAESESSKSFWVNMDTMPVNPTMIWDVYPYSTNFQTVLVSWRGNSTTVTNDQYNPEIFNLSAGVHQLIVVGREDDVQLGQISILAVPPAPSGLHVISP